MKTNVVSVPVATHDEREAGTGVSWLPLHILPTPHCSENSRLWVWLSLSQSGPRLRGAVPAQTERASSSTSILIIVGCEVRLHLQQFSSVIHSINQTHIWTLWEAEQDTEDRTHKRLHARVLMIRLQPPGEHFIIRSKRC